jgi:predicted transcriptional regulator
MAEKTKTLEITVAESQGAFSIFRIGKAKKEIYDFSGITALRQLLSNEKAKIINTIKSQKPSSIYDLAKKLGRRFKSVNDDLKLLQRFGLVDFTEEKINGRIRHKPIVVVDKINLNINL